MEKDDPLIVQIFGSEEGRGGVIFSDAFPEKWPALELDITNVHYPQYYGKEVWQGAPVPPADYLSPKPVYFLTVTAGTAFWFNLRAMKADILEQVGRYAREAIELLGLGAKTHAGYGGMTVTDA